MRQKSGKLKEPAARQNRRAVDGCGLRAECRLMAQSRPSAPSVSRSAHCRITDRQMWGHKGENNPKGADGGLCHYVIFLFFASIPHTTRLC